MRHVMIIVILVMKIFASSAVMLWQVSTTPEGQVLSPLAQQLFDKISWAFTTSLGALFGHLTGWAGNK